MFLKSKKVLLILQNKPKDFLLLTVYLCYNRKYEGTFMKLLLNKNKKAMTLIEIMCVLVIISIVTSITLPSINNFRSSERCKAEASVLVSCIRQAKYQALQDNCLNRIILDYDEENKVISSLKIQKFEKQILHFFECW